MGIPTLLLKIRFIKVGKKRGKRGRVYNIYISGILPTPFTPVITTITECAVY